MQVSLRKIAKQKKILRAAPQQDVPRRSVNVATHNDNAVINVPVRPYTYQAHTLVLHTFCVVALKTLIVLLRNWNDLDIQPSTSPVRGQDAFSTLRDAATPACIACTLRVARQITRLRGVV